MVEPLDVEEVVAVAYEDGMDVGKSWENEVTSKVRFFTPSKTECTRATVPATSGR